MTRDRLGLLLGLAGVAMFGVTLPATRLAVEDFSPAFVSAGRAFVAGVLAAAILLVMRRRLPRRETWGRLALGSALLVAGFPIFTSIALTTAEASHGGVVLAVLPLATAAFAMPLARERPAPAFWVFAGLGSLLVLVFVLRGSGGALVPADGLFLLAVLCAAPGYAVSGTLSRDMPGWEVICWQLVLALPFTALATAALAPGLPPDPSWSAIGGFAYVALVSQFLGFFAWNAGLALGGVARVGQVQLLQTFITLAASAVLLGERIGPDTFAFAAAIIALVALGRRSSVARRLEPSGPALPLKPPGL